MLALSQTVLGAGPVVPVAVYGTHGYEATLDVVEPTSLALLLRHVSQSQLQDLRTCLKLLFLHLLLLLMHLLLPLLSALL